MAEERRTDHASIDLEEALHRFRVEEALSACTRSLLANASRLEVSRALRALAVELDVEVIGVARTVDHPDLGLCASFTYWVDTSTEFPRDDDFYDLVPWDRIPQARDRLAGGELNHFGSLAELAEIERSLYLESPAGLRAAIEAPVIDGGDWIGHVALASRRERRWSDAELRTAEDLAATFAGAWARRDDLAEARQAIVEQSHALAVERALVECANGLLAADATEPLERATRAILGAARGTFAYIARHLPDLPSAPHLEVIEAATTADEDARSALGVIPWSAWPGGFRQLTALRPYAFGSLDEIVAADRELMATRPVPVEAEVDYPVAIGGRIVGVVGVADS